MAAVLSVTTARIRDGKTPEAMAAYGKLKKILERLGGKVRVLSQGYGAAPLTITTVVEFAGWAEFGAFSAKAETDKELQALVTEIRAKPFSDITARGISTELTV